MADIKKIKVNGTEYDVQPEWASLNECGLPTIGTDGLPPYIRFGTYTDPAEGYNRNQIEIVANDIVLGYSASCRSLFGEGDSCTLFFGDIEIGYADGTVNLNGNSYLNGADISIGTGNSVVNITGGGMQYGGIRLAYEYTGEFFSEHITIGTNGTYGRADIEICGGGENFGAHVTVGQYPSTGESGVHINRGFPDGTVCTWLGGLTQACGLEVAFISAHSGNYNGTPDLINVYGNFRFSETYNISFGSLVLDKSGIKLGSAKLSGSGNMLTATADSVFVEAPVTSIGQGDGTVYLYGTVLVNNEPIGDGSVPWADYDSGTKALSIGAEGGLVKIGTANGVLKLGTGVTGVEIGMGTATANLFDGQIMLNRISDPYYLIWLGTHDGKISVGDPEDGLTGARVLIGTDCISMGSTAKALTIGTDSISMGTGGMTIGTDCISMGTGGMTIGTRALTLGSAAVKAGNVTLDWTGLTAGGDNCMVTVGDTTLSRYGLDVTGGTNGQGVWYNGDGLTLGKLSGGCSLSANPTANSIEIGTKGGSDAVQPSLVLNGVTLSYDATAGTVTLSADGKSATIQLS